MGFLEFLMLCGIVIAALCGVGQAINEIRTGKDSRTPEQRLMDATISDGVTRVGSVLDAVNANARGRKPATRM